MRKLFKRLDKLLFAKNQTTYDRALKMFNSKQIYGRITTAEAKPTQLQMKGRNKY